MFSFNVNLSLFVVSCLILFDPTGLRAQTTLSPQCLEDIDLENSCFAECNFTTGNASNVPICQTLCHNTCLQSSGPDCCPNVPSQVGSIYCCQINDVLPQSECNQAAANETNCFKACDSQPTGQVQSCKENCKGQCLTASCEECCPADLPSVCGTKVVAVTDCLIRADVETQCASACNSINNVNHAVCLSQCHESCLLDTCAFRPETSCDTVNCCPLVIPTFCDAKVIAPQVCHDARADEEQCFATCADEVGITRSVCEEKCSAICRDLTCDQCCPGNPTRFCSGSLSGTQCLTTRLGQETCNGLCLFNNPTSLTGQFACLVGCHDTCLATSTCEDPCCPRQALPSLCGADISPESIANCNNASAALAACYSSACSSLPTGIQQVTCLVVNCKLKCEFDSCERCCRINAPGQYCGSKMLTPEMCLASYNAQLACSLACEVSGPGNTPCRKQCYDKCQSAACDTCCIDYRGTTLPCLTAEGVDMLHG